MTDLSNPFVIIDAITKSKIDYLKDPRVEREYNPFMVNRALSYFVDTLDQANRVNSWAHVDKKLQHDYLMATVTPKKRFAKWHKKKEDENLNIIKEYYGYSDARAREALTILTEEQIEQIKNKNNKGG